MGMKGSLRTVGVILIGIVVIIGIAVASLLFISGIPKRATYLEPWKKDYALKFDDPRIQLAAHGLLAANGHNMQPWKIRLDRNDPDIFYLYADAERLTKEVDPSARQMMITQGAFLKYVAIAGDEIGYTVHIRLFPQGGYNERKLNESMDAMPVAKITLAKAVPQSTPLYENIFLPDTNRAPYRSTRLTSEEIDWLKNINSDGDMSILIFQDKEDIAKLEGYAMESVSVEAGVNRIMKETEDIFRPNEFQKNKYRYGFSVEGQGTSGIMKHLMQGLVTLFPSLNKGKAASDMMIRSTRTALDNTPAYAMIISKGNTRRNQIKSGMLYSKLVLSAHRLGFVMQPLSQALEEYPEMNKLYSGIHRDYANGGETIQMLVRLGKPAQNVPQTMRRDIMDLIVE